MSVTQEQPRPAHTEMDHAWRKRPAHLTVPADHPSIKRLKHSSTTSSSGHTTSQTKSSRPSNATSSGRAERWFDLTNEHPRGVAFVDNDPPYFMKAQPPDGFTHNVAKIGPTAPTRSLLAQMDAHNDDGDDFRSVIDDLTVQNKKLKKKLKKYQMLHCSHLQEEKLFEVRVHGLAANRKRELEETLRSFASSIDEDSPHRPWAAGGYPPGPQKPAPQLHKRPSSTTSISKAALDSTYASMSGQTGGASLSHPPEHHDIDKEFHPSRQNGKSYLHDIPKAMAPKPAVAMSDRSKSKAVVRRLEQLFTGKGAASCEQRQSQQQSEVSQSGTQAEPKFGGRGRQWSQEGAREAHILSGDAELRVDTIEEAKMRVSNDESRPSSVRFSQPGSPRSPEQRPTRLLDLDLQRAQVGSDNMEYIRHLGLSSSATDIAYGPGDDKNGWVYLNLLTSMAQLHTLNVTPEIVRKAVADVSSKLELSPDLTKVRWKGGHSGTRMSSDGDESDHDMDRKSPGSSVVLSSHDEAQEKASHEAHHAGDPWPAPEVGAKTRPINTNETRNDDDNIQYRPLFFHTAVSDEEQSDVETDSITSSEAPDVPTATGINSEVAPLRDRVTRLRGPKRNDGPLIFYNGAQYCTDLSGDFDRAAGRQTRFRRFTRQPIGGTSQLEDDSDESDADEIKSEHSERATSQDVDMDSTGSALDLDDLKSVISDYASRKGFPVDAMDMEASGLGGIHPEDNFVVSVQVRHGNKKRDHHRRLSSFFKPKGQNRKMSHDIPRSSVDAFRKPTDVAHSREGEVSVTGEIVSTLKTDLAPSALPPPSYVCLPFSASGSDDDDDPGDAADSIPNHVMDYGDRAPPTVSRKVSKKPDMSGETRKQNTLHNHHRAGKNSYRSLSSDAGSDTGSDDSSIDLLAHARGLDPDTIAAREREFESNNGDMAEVPTGSSAATVGGGSAKVSPATADDGKSDVDSMSVDGSADNSE